MTEVDSLGVTKVIKTDQKGRVRITRERREMLLEEFEKSSMTAAAFAGMIGVNIQTFYGWCRQRKRVKQPAAVKGKDAEKPLQLVEAVIAPKSQEPSPTLSLMLHLPGGGHLELTDTSQVPMAAELLKLLQASGATC